MAQRFATEPSIDIFKKNTVFVIINIQAQYKLKISPGSFKLTLQCLHPRAIFLGAKLFITTLLMRNKVLKMNLFGLCENAWFPWQPIILFKNGNVSA